MVLEVRNATYNKEKASCRYDFYFEKKTNTLHIRDQNKDLSVTEQLNLQPYSFIYHIRLQFENAFNFKLPVDCKIYVYTRDAIVYEWRDNVMKLIPSEKMSTAHQPYLKRKRERDQRAYPQ